MSLESVIAENTAAIKELTALLKGSVVEMIPPKAEERIDVPEKPAAPEPEAPAELTYEEVAALVGKACLVSRAKVKAILADYKAANLSGVPKGKWPEVKGRLETLIAEGA